MGIGGVIMDNVFVEPFKRFVEKIADFLPSVLIGLVIVCVGIIAAWLLRRIVTKISAFLNIDKLSDWLGVMQILQRSGYNEPLSKLIGRLVYWLVLISFLIIGLNALKIPAVEDLLTEFLLYLPNIIVACIVVIAGYTLANFLGRAALIASVNAGVAFSGLIGKFVKFTVFIMAVTMALELLGIGKDTVIIAFAIVFGGVVLALSIAFGLGGKDAAKIYIDRMCGKKKDEDDISHI
ncbi:hypothetical protein BMS3Abin09_00679 [bacterium BMS3Abin09]|nr:hypothetical protein BMS3Abin09_00679 [bacterium BMS3Abin09]GBE40653.1 hypothetical protein BMS3Bbin09_00539 [bacterium BMS3Bbin09]HDN94838.1 hypothetical protein [Nitrospirota bacterium]HDO67541.1 hypothetical protein [Nitrospirota bacterium]HEW81715.1 hypothetical protein [Nitrospirota bacterium]